MRFDIVLVGGPKGSEFDGLIRQTGLGTRPRRAAPALCSYFRRTRPKAVIVSPPTLAPVGLLAGRLTGTPIIPWEANFVETDVVQPGAPRRARLLPTAQRLTYRWAAFLAAVSRDVAAHVADAHSDLARMPTFELPNPIDLAATIREAAAEPTVVPAGEGAFSICASGRFTRQKGFDLLIAALARYGDQIPVEWRLTILGDGPWRDHLAHQARIADLDARIDLPGRLRNPFPVIGSADIFVHPARWEGFGMVLLEALALGIPVIATDCPGGPREILAGGRFGRIVPSEDPDALGRALLDLYNDPLERRRLAGIGPKRARMYGPSRIAERVISLVESV